ncbi:MAG: hypothetical protein C4324_01670 [Blastocatellia bacterium]
MAQSVRPAKVRVELKRKVQREGRLVRPKNWRILARPATVRIVLPDRLEEALLEKDPWESSKTRDLRNGE